MRSIGIEFCLIIFWKVCIAQGNQNGTKETIESLPIMKVIQNPLTVSGFAAGASMAQQLHISSSERFDGVGVFAGVFYRCVGESRNATECSNGVNDSISDAMKYETEKKIDMLNNLKNDKLFFWLGIVPEEPEMLIPTLQIINFYQYFIHNPANILTKLQSSFQLLPTNSVTHPCGEPILNLSLPLGNCNYSGSYEVLKFLTNTQMIFPSSNTTLQPLRLFNQTQFFGKWNSKEIGMDDIGFYYVPLQCGQGNPCLVHVFLHGCHFRKDSRDSTFVQKSGFLEVAEANNIILLFPQALLFSEENPKSLRCWDYEGFTGPDYANRRGAQILVINRMIDRMFGVEDEGSTSSTSVSTSSSPESTSSSSESTSTSSETTSSSSANTSSSTDTTSSTSDSTSSTPSNSATEPNTRNRNWGVHWLAILLISISGIHEEVFL